MLSKKILILLASWWICIALIVLAATVWLPFTPTFPYYEVYLEPIAGRWLATWAHFDGVYYMNIINNGYDVPDLVQAFFPAFPLLIAGLSTIGINQILLASVFSVSCLALGLHVLYRLLQLDEHADIAWRSLVTLLAFPTSFFFAAVYTESLFFLILVSTIYAARKNRWWLAGLLGSILAATRVTGIVIIPVLWMEYWHRRKDLPRTTFLATCLPCLGLGAYMLYLQFLFNDPLRFMTVQSDFGANRSTSSLVSPVRVLYRYIKMIATVQPGYHIYYTLFHEVFSALLAFFAVVWNWFGLRRSYAILVLVSVLVPISTGTFSSMLRYILPLFPIYVMIVKLLPKRLWYVWICCSLVLLIINLCLFTMGLWVA